MGRGAEFFNDYLVISRVLPLFGECNKTKNHRSNTSCDKTLKRRVDAAKCKMKKVIKHILYLCLPLVSFVLLTGCIKENLEGCERCIGFEYFADGDTDVFPEYIQRVSLYVFDENDQMVSTSQLGRENPIILEQDDLNKYQGVKLMLTGGRYRFVALGNPNTKQHTEVYNVDSGNMSEILYSHPDCTTTEVEGNDPLYLGSKVVDIPDDVNFKTKVRLYSSHQKVTVTVKGYIPEGSDINAQAAQSDLKLRLVNVSSQTDFYHEDATVVDQNLAMGDLVAYNPTLMLDNETGWYEASFNILRHTADSTFAFEIIESATERVLFTVSLVEFLKAFYEVDITKQEALIPMIVEFTDEVIVTIPNWMLEHRDPIYGKN